MASESMTFDPTKKPKIVFGVTSEMSNRLLGDVPGFFASRGWEVVVVSNSGKVPVGAQNFKGARHHEIKMSRKPSLLPDLLALRAWVVFLQDFKPDVISVGTPKAALLAMSAGWWLRVPVRIYHLRGLRLESSHLVLKIVLYAVETMTAFFSTHVIAVSHSLREEFLRRRLSTHEKVVVLGAGSSHGVNITPDLSQLTTIKPEYREKLELAKEKNRPVIAFAGRFSKDKGSRAFGEMRLALFRAGIDHEFLVIGPVEDSGETLEQAHPEILRPPLIVGEVDDIFPVLSYVSLMVLPTLREGFPNVVLEAAVMSIPTVTTSATGAIDSVLHGVTGLVVPPRDSAAFAAAVVSLMEQPKLLKIMGSNAHETAAARFESNRVSELHFRFCVAVLG